MNMDSPSGAASTAIPVLTHVVPTSDIPAAVLVALDARMAEKASVLALSAELMQNLRPELDRMASELVQRSVEGMWAKRAEIYKNISRSPDEDR
ncbi:hypothetical protein [Limnohabitans sp.]|jgi:hypothetical protein